MEKAAIHLSAVSMLMAASFAHAEKCDAPPYGDTMVRYEAIEADFAQAEREATDLPPGMLMKQLRAALREACRAKFNHGSRASYYRNGINDGDINSFTTTQLTNAWFVARNRAMAKEIAPTSEPPSGAPPPPAPQIENGSHIYALAYCLKNGMCQLHGDSHLGYGGQLEEVPYQTLADCQRYAYINSSGIKQSPDGRTVLPDGSWWECRSKRVDTWEPAQ
jgi:hypothetical protein